MTTWRRHHDGHALNTLMAPKKKSGGKDDGASSIQPYCEALKSAGVTTVSPAHHPSRGTATRNKQATVVERPRAVYALCKDVGTCATRGAHSSPLHKHLPCCCTPLQLPDGHVIKKWEATLKVWSYALAGEDQVLDGRHPPALGALCLALLTSTGARLAASLLACHPGPPAPRPSTCVLVPACWCLPLHGRAAEGGGLQGAGGAVHTLAAGAGGCG